MFEEINQHRLAVAENIQKAVEIGFTDNELEKAHKVGDIHPNGKWVWTQLPSGKYDWRVIKKQGGGSSATATATAQKQTSEGKKSWDKQEAFFKKETDEYKLLDNLNNYLKRKDPFYQREIQKIFEKKFPQIDEWKLTTPNTGRAEIRAIVDGKEVASINLNDASGKSIIMLQTFMDKCSEVKGEEKKQSESFQSPKEIADFIAKKFGTKVKRINGTVTFGNWGDYGAHSGVGDCYEVQIDDTHKIRVGIVNYATKDWMHCRKGEILMQTAVKSSTLSGKKMFQWNKDGLTSYKPGSNFKDYLEKEYVGSFQRKIGKQLYSE